MPLHDRDGAAWINERRKGFTMIEVMVVLVVAAILSAVAYPSYVESVRKSRRAEGRAALIQIMQQQERFYTQHNTYVPFSSSSTDEHEKKFKWFSGNAAKDSAYEIKAEACSNEMIQDCVRLTAMPGTENVNTSYRDPVCGDLVLTSTGVHSADNPNCWK